MCNYFKRKLNPSFFQGNLRSKHYFEGWYLKIVDAKAEVVYAIIPGVSLDATEGSHAFIQVINGKTSETHYVEYAMDEFLFSKKDFSIQIGKNTFSKSGMELSIQTDTLNIKGKIIFGKFSPWPVRLFSPGAMSWYTYVPFMECYHGVVSFDHTITGHLLIDGTNHSFEGGKGYIEKDWGRSFPLYYIWIQSNHFEQEGVSLMASVAKIPWLGTSFDGFVVGLLVNKKLYRFANYTQAKINRLEWFHNKAIIHLVTKKNRLEIEVERIHPSGELKSPLLGAMKNRIRESLTSIVKVSLFEGKGNNEKLIYRGTGYNTGFEIGGEIEKMKQKKP